MKKLYKWEVMESVMQDYLCAGCQLKRAVKLALLIRIVEQDKLLAEEVEEIISGLSKARENILDFISAYHASGEDLKDLLAEGAVTIKQIKVYTKRINQIAKEVQNGQNNNQGR